MLASIGVLPGAAGQTSGGYNLLPNSSFMSVRSGYWPDWWNWYNALGNDAIKLDECWQLADENYVPGTRSVKLSAGAKIQTSYLRILFQKGIPLTFSAWLKSDRPDTKVKLVIYQDGWNALDVAEVSVGLDWQRCHLTATPGKRSTSQHNFVHISLEGPGTLWVNAPQLEEGAACTEWKPCLKDRRRNADEEAETPAEPQFAIPRIDCTKIDTAPVIDGTLDDDAWKQAAAADTFMRLDETAAAKYATDAYICRDDDSIYVGFRCHEPDMDRIRAKATLRDSTDLFRDDSVEILLSANEDGSDYLRFAANAAGTKVDSKGFTMFFDTDWDCATATGDAFWSVEFRLPFSSLVRPLQPGTPWRLNLARFRAPPKEEEYSAWAPVIRTFHDFAHFGLLRGVVAEVGRIGTETLDTGELAAYFDRSFYTREPEAQLFIDAPGGTAVHLRFNGTERQETLPATRLLAIDLSTVSHGKYLAEVAIDERRANLLLRKLVPKENMVKIDRLHRIFLVDEEPFIPVGSTVNVKAVNMQADLGLGSGWVNMHEAVTAQSQERLRNQLDAASRRGMKLIIWYMNYALLDDPAEYQAELLELVRAFKDHPALLGWFVFDEPRSNIQWLKGLCEAVREADPYHPPFVNWCDRGHGWTREMGDVSGDVNCLDGYYINAYDYTPNEAFREIGGHCTDMTADAGRRGNVVAYINGIYGWASAIREPSPAENRFVTYVSLIRGARMLLYYNWGPPANPALLASFKPLCREIKTLTPIVAADEVKEKVVCDNDRIDYTAFQTEDGITIIALNTDENNEQATFRIEGSRGEAIVLFEDRKRRIEDGSFRDTFLPIERHVYRVAGAAQE